MKRKRTETEDTIDEKEKKQINNEKKEENKESSYLLHYKHPLSDCPGGFCNVTISTRDNQQIRTDRVFLATSSQAFLALLSIDGKKVSDLPLDYPFAIISAALAITARMAKTERETNDFETEEIFRLDDPLPGDAHWMLDLFRFAVAYQLPFAMDYSLKRLSPSDFFSMQEVEAIYHGLEGFPCVQGTAEVREDCLQWFSKNMVLSITELIKPLPAASRDLVLKITQEAEDEIQCRGIMETLWTFARGSRTLVDVDHIAKQIESSAERKHVIKLLKPFIENAEFADSVWCRHDFNNSIMCVCLEAICREKTVQETARALEKALFLTQPINEIC